VIEAEERQRKAEKSVNWAIERAKSLCVKHFPSGKYGENTRTTDCSRGHLLEVAKLLLYESSR
jgi:hypothetical protein